MQQDGCGKRSRERERDEQPEPEQRGEQHERGARGHCRDDDCRRVLRLRRDDRRHRGQRPRTLETQARKADAEERAAPFPHERRGGVRAAALERLRDLRRQLARVGERVEQLVVFELGGIGRRQSNDELAGAMQFVLQRGQRFAFLEQQLRIRRELIEVAEHRSQVDPETGHNSRVGTRRTAAERLPHRLSEHTPLDSPGAVAVGRGKTVLVVDDEKAIRLVCRVNLEVDGFRVFEAGTLDQAREVIAAEDVDVALIDVHVGAGNGLDLVRELRQQDPRRAIALLTGSVELSMEERAGADGILGKPFTIDELLEVVHRLATAVDSQQ